MAPGHSDVLPYTMLLASQPLQGHFWSMELVTWGLDGNRINNFVCHLAPFCVVLSFILFVFGG